MGRMFYNQLEVTLEGQHMTRYNQLASMLHKENILFYRKMGSIITRTTYKSTRTTYEITRTAHMTFYQQMGSLFTGIVRDIL